MVSKPPDRLGEYVCKVRNNLRHKDSLNESALLTPEAIDNSELFYIRVPATV